MTVDKIVKKVSSKKGQLSIESFFGKKEIIPKRLVNIAKNVEVEKQFKEVVEKTEITESCPVVKNEVKEELSATLDDKTRSLLDLELSTMEDSWFNKLKEEFVKPYFLELKQFVQREQASNTVFPPPGDIYSWSRLTPFDKVKVVIIGQDPYHNFNQAHGLAFSVKSPTPAPPSLKNIYKELKNNYDDFEINNTKGDLSCWASQGVLLLNTSLTVRAHNANSHAKHGWEQLTSRVVELLIQDREMTGRNIVFLLWGNNAIKLVETLLNKVSKQNNKNWKTCDNLLVLKSVHPSPLSASRGFFGNNHFRKINEWLYKEKKEKMIDWSVGQDNYLKEVKESNSNLE